MHIFLTTLGVSWAVIPELLLWLDDPELRFYQHHPEANTLRRQREEAQMHPVDELWVVTTTGTDVEQLRVWWRAHGQGRRLRVFQFGEADLGSAAAVRAFRELVFTVTAHARQQTTLGKLWISLAGGRKTMSADMQAAATFFGCDGLLHVLDRSPRGAERLPDQAEAFLGSWPSAQIERVLPLLTERELSANPLTERLTLPPLPESPTAAVRGAYATPFLDQIEARLRESANLLANYRAELLDGEQGTNFLALYSLSRPKLEELRRRRLGVDPARREAELTWLRALPKPELHCHLGGVLRAAELVEVAEVHRAEVERHAGLQSWVARWRPLVRQQRWSELRDLIQSLPQQWKSLRAPQLPEPLAVCAFLLEFADHVAGLDELIFGDARAEGSFVGQGIEAYERLGDLQGSGLLQSVPTIHKATELLLRQAARENVRYLEIRCSPLNYTRGGCSAQEVVQTIQRACAAFPHVQTRLLFIGSRHGDPEVLQQHVALAQQLAEAGFGDLVGFDLAGHEEQLSPAQLRETFLPLLQRCFQITIHAGETADARSIWEAVYHLQADRIGHGLTLREQPELLRRFLDRRIAIEMCPSSNVQIVGFRDNYLPHTERLPRYPLQEYLNQGLRVCVNTDNPGISRSDLSQELHRAARLTPAGLSPWELFLLLRNGFAAGFCDRAERKRLLQTAEQEAIQSLESAAWRALQ